MSLSRFGPISARALRNPELCWVCSARQMARVPPAGHTASSTSSIYQSPARKSSMQKRHYAAQNIDVSKVRRDVDNRARLGFYTLSNKQGALRMDPHKADSIYADFLHHKNKMDHGSNIRRLAESKSLQYPID